MRDNKIVVVVADDIETWQKINVTAFLAAGVADRAEGVIGAPYEDGSQRQYTPLFNTPVHVYAAPRDKLSTVLGRAVTRPVVTSVYIEDMFITDNDHDNRATVEKYATEDLPLVGLALCGEPKQIDKVTRGIKRHD